MRILAALALLAACTHDEPARTKPSEVHCYARQHIPSAGPSAGIPADLPETKCTPNKLICEDMRADEATLGSDYKVSACERAVDPWELPYTARESEHCRDEGCALLFRTKEECENRLREGAELMELGKCRRSRK